MPGSGAWPPAPHPASARAPLEGGWLPGIPRLSGVVRTERTNATRCAHLSPVCARCGSLMCGSPAAAARDRGAFWRLVAFDGRMLTFVTISVLTRSWIVQHPHETHNFNYADCPPRARQRHASEPCPVTGSAVRHCRAATSRSIRLSVRPARATIARVRSHHVHAAAAREHADGARARCMVVALDFNWRLRAHRLCT